MVLNKYLNPFNGLINERVHKVCFLQGQVFYIAIVIVILVIIISNQHKHLFFLTDIALICITRNCLSLTAVDLSGCSELSDGGIASFLKLHPRGFKVFIHQSDSLFLNPNDL